MTTLRQDIDFHGLFRKLGSFCKFGLSRSRYINYMLVKSLIPTPNLLTEIRSRYNNYMLVKSLLPTPGLLTEIRFHLTRQIIAMPSSFCLFVNLPQIKS